MLTDLVRKNRSYRRFDSSQPVSGETLKELIGLARLCPSRRNQQALRFMLVQEAHECASVFSTLSWGGYLAGWQGPEEGRRPTAYIIILGDTQRGSNFDTDMGIAAQTIMLGAAEKGLGGCMIASIKRDPLRESLHIPEPLEILLVLAIGFPGETVVVEPMSGGEIRYWRDEKQVHHVPKRSVDELLFYNRD